MSDLSITDSEVWRNILLKLEPKEVQQLCRTNTQLNKICQDPAFYQEYLAIRNLPIPKPINLAQVYLDHYLQLDKAQKFMDYIKYQTYFYSRREHDESEHEGLLINLKDILDHVDEDLFEGINTRGLITPFLNKIRQIPEDDHEFSPASIQILPRSDYSNEVNEFAIKLFIDDEDDVEFDQIPVDEIKKLIDRCLDRDITFRDLGDDNDPIEFPVYLKV